MKATSPVRPYYIKMLNRYDAIFYCRRVQEAEGAVENLNQYFPPIRQRSLVAFPGPSDTQVRLLIKAVSQ
jgi:hypothetical protein